MSLIDLVLETKLHCIKLTIYLFWSFIIFLYFPLLFEFSSIFLYFKISQWSRLFKLLAFTWSDHPICACNNRFNQFKIQKISATTSDRQCTCSNSIWFINFGIFHFIASYIRYILVWLLLIFQQLLKKLNEKIPSKKRSLSIVRLIGHYVIGMLKDFNYLLI